MGQEIAIQVDAGVASAEVVFAFHREEFVAELRTNEMGVGGAAFPNGALNDSGIGAGVESGWVSAFLCGPDDAGNIRSDAVQGLSSVAISQDAFENPVYLVEVVYLDADPGSQTRRAHDPIVAMDVGVGVGDEGALFSFAGGFAVDEESLELRAVLVEFGEEFLGSGAAVGGDENPIAIL